jgi:hypothetical protein
VRWVELFALKTGSAVAMDEAAARALAVAMAGATGEGRSK